MGELPHSVGQSMSGQLKSPITSTVLAEEKGVLKYERMYSKIEISEDVGAYITHIHKYRFT